jgi:hypothetical protein
MKKLLFLILAFFLGNSINLLAQNNIKNAQIEYTANTRGFYQKIWITNQTIAISSDRNDTVMPTATKIALKDWKFLTVEFKKLKLAGLSKLKPPTAKRQYDGAAIADLKIIQNGKTYQTESFDNGYPNIKIKKFVDKITSLAKK